MTHTNQSTTTEFLDGIATWETQQLQRALDTIRQELSIRPDCDSIYIVWELEDVQWRRPDLTNSECRYVLHCLDRWHDAEIGINWDVVDSAADTCFAAPDNLAELREMAE